MPTSAKVCLLIDLQNRRPEPQHVAAWMGADGEAWIFYGEHEIGCLPAYFELGPQVSIVPISRPGRNSLDFHLVMYLGYLVAKRAHGSKFIIVAADADYDAAVAHAQAQGIDVVRTPELSLAPQQNTDSSPRRQAAPIDATLAGSPQSAAPAPLIKHVAPGGDPLPIAAAKKKAKTTIATYAAVLQDIRGLHRPKDLGALTSRIASRLGSTASPANVDKILARLVTMDLITTKNGQLTYCVKAGDAN